MMTLLMWWALGAGEPPVAEPERKNRMLIARHVRRRRMRSRGHGKKLSKRIR